MTGDPDKNTFPPAVWLRVTIPALVTYCIVLPTPVANSPWTWSSTYSLVPVKVVIENWISLPKEVNPTVETPTTSPIS